MKSLAAMAVIALASPSIHVTPASVHRGHVVRVHGSVSGECAKGDTVTVISRAFSHRHDFAGLPAIYAVARSGGKYSTRPPRHPARGGTPPPAPPPPAGAARGPPGSPAGGGGAIGACAPP